MNSIKIYINKKRYLKTVQNYFYIDSLVKIKKIKFDTINIINSCYVLKSLEF
jgi:hypothetical protein